MHRNDLPFKNRSSAGLLFAESNFNYRKDYLRTNVLALLYKQQHHVLPDIQKFMPGQSRQTKRLLEC